MWWDNKETHHEQAGWKHISYTVRESAALLRFYNVYVRVSTMASILGLCCCCCCPAAWWAWEWRRLGRCCWVCVADEAAAGAAAPAAVCPAQEWQKLLSWSLQRGSAWSPSSTESSLGCSLCGTGPAVAAASGSSPSSPGCRLSPTWSWAPVCGTLSPEWLWVDRCSCWCDLCAFSPQ